MPCRAEIDSNFSTGRISGFRAVAYPLKGIQTLISETPRLPHA